MVLYRDAINGSVVDTRATCHLSLEWVVPVLCMGKNSRINLMLSRSWTCRCNSLCSSGLILYVAMFGNVAPGNRSMVCCISCVGGSFHGNSSSVRSENSSRISWIWCCHGFASGCKVWVFLIRAKRLPLSWTIDAKGHSARIQSSPVAESKLCIFIGCNTILYIWTWRNNCMCIHLIWPSDHIATVSLVADGMPSWEWCCSAMYLCSACLKKMRSSIDAL